MVPKASHCAAAYLPPVPRTSALTAFCIEQLRLNPDVTLPDLRARALLEGILIHPAVFHRARATLGLAPARLRRPRPKAPAAAPDLVADVAKGGVDFDSLVRAVTALRDERDKLRSALERMRGAITTALA